MRLPTPPKSPSAYTQLRRLLATIILSPILGYCLFHSASSSLFGDTASTLCPALKAHCESLLDTPSGYHTSRLSRLANTLSSSNATWVAEPGASAEYYLGGFSTRDWFLSERSFLVVVKWTGEVVLLTPEFERLRAQGVGRDKEVDVEWVAWAEDQDPFAVLSEHLDDDSPLVFDGKIRNFISEGMARVRQKNTEERVTAGFAAAELGKEVSLLRERKDQREIGLLRCANQMTLHAIRETRKKMHLGISESKTREKLSEELARVGLDGEGGLVLFGGDAALPHGSGTNRKLGREEMILIDVGGIWGGYVADITRVSLTASSSSVTLIHSMHNADIWNPDVRTPRLEDPPKAHRRLGNRPSSPTRAIRSTEIFQHLSTTYARRFGSRSSFRHCFGLLCSRIPDLYPSTRPRHRLGSPRSAIPRSSCVKRAPLRPCVQLGAWYLRPQGN